MSQTNGFAASSWIVRQPPRQFVPVIFLMEIKPTLMIDFMLRHFNDIDHLAPVAWKLKMDGHSVAVYCMNPRYDIESDYRLQFLKRLGMSVSHLSNAFGRHRDPIYKILCHLSQKCFDIQNKFATQETADRKRPREAFGEFFGNVGWLFYKMRRKIYYNACWARSILARSKAQAICFDYVMPNLYVVDIFMRAAKKMSIPIIALPHGIQVYTNAEPKPKSMDSRRSTKFNRFDYVIAPNQLRKEILVRSGIDEEKIIVLGSARYCREWLDQNKIILPNTMNTVGSGNGKLKVILMPSKPHARLDVERMLSTCAMLADLAEVHAMIKPHTRSKGHKELFVDIPLTDASQIPTAELLEWADVLLVVASSVILETLMKGKPALYLKYLHPNTTLFEEMGACWVIHDEAELKNALLSLSSDKNSVPYTEDNVNKLLTEVVYGGKRERAVLAAYENFLLKVCRQQNCKTKS